MESKFRLYIRRLLAKSGVWTACVEHRSGGTAGWCDLGVQINSLLMPVELKVAKPALVTDILHSSRIRPAQILFLDAASRAGIRARLLLGVHTPALGALGWTAYLLRDIRRERLRHWRKGFGFHELEIVAQCDELLVPPDQW